MEKFKYRVIPINKCCLEVTTVYVNYMSTFVGEITYFMNLSKSLIMTHNSQVTKRNIYQVINIEIFKFIINSQFILFDIDLIF